MNRIRVISADSALTPKDNGSYSSRVTFMVGNAALEAAESLKALLVAAAAKWLKAFEQDVEVIDEMFVVSGGDAAGGLSYHEVVKAALVDTGTITVKGTFTCPIEYQGYLISPIKARHKPEEDALNFIFEKDGRSLLYATDTGLWEEATWEYLKGFQLDLMILECTEGVVPTDYEGHLGVTDFMNVLERLRGQGTLKQDTIISTTHHSHNGGATHADLEQLFSPKSILVGYDGLELTI